MVNFREYIDSKLLFKVEKTTASRTQGIFLKRIKLCVRITVHGLKNKVRQKVRVDEDSLL